MRILDKGVSGRSWGGGGWGGNVVDWEEVGEGGGGSPHKLDGKGWVGNCLIDGGGN